MRHAGYTLLIGMFIIAIAGCQNPSDTTFANTGAMSPEAMNQTAPPAAVRADTMLPDLTENSTLQDYLTYAALNNSGLEAAFNRWKAAVERVPQVTSLPDPRFTYRYYIEEVETRVGPQRQAFEISQMFPWFRKLSLRGDAAAEAAKAARQQYESVKLDLFYQVKDAWYEYYYVQQAIGTIEENIELLKNLESVVRIRYQTAEARHPDLIRVQVELGKLEDQLKTIRDLQQPVVARLNAALNRPPQAPVTPPAEIQEEYIAPSDDAILAMMADKNPQLMAMRHEIARSRAEVQLAKKDYYPDVTFGLNFIDTADRTGPNPPSDNGKDPVIAMLSLNLPIWRGKLAAGVRQSRYQYHAAMHTQTQKLNALNAQLKMALYQYRDAERKINLYGDTLLPKAVESVKANEASFRSGESTFLEVIDAQRVLLNFELEYQRALSNKAQRLAQLEMLTGTSLPRKSVNKAPVQSDQTPAGAQDNQETLND